MCGRVWTCVPFKRCIKSSKFKQILTLNANLHGGKKYSYHVVKCDCLYSNVIEKEVGTILNIDMIYMAGKSSITLLPSAI
jgi:hypothetical protein